MRTRGTLRGIHHSDVNEMRSREEESGETREKRKGSKEEKKEERRK